MTTLVASVADGQDVLAVGTATGVAGSVVQVPVFLRDVQGTPLGVDAGAGKRIQAIAFKVTCTPASAVTAVAFIRAGVTLALTPLYETTVESTVSARAIGWLGSFAEATNPIGLTLNASAPGDRIGTIQLTISGAAPVATVIALSVDPATAIVANQTGSIVEKSSAGTLMLTNGSVTVSAATTTTITSSSNPSAPGQSITLFANVTSGTAGAISGTITFQDGSAPLGTMPVVAGQAALATSALTEGLHSVTAEYNGDAQFAPSTSTALSQSVARIPTGVTATALSTSEVSVTWDAMSGIDHFEVYRSFNDNPYGLVGLAPTNTYSDTTVSGGITYLYYVTAVTASAATSPGSTIDPATTVMFTDDPAGPATRIKAIHITELRTAVYAFRLSAGEPPVTFDPLTGPILAAHVDALRSALASARSTLVLPAIPFTDPSLTSSVTRIKSEHVQQLRGGVQ
ncbi:MAG: Ig-like domain repeat protein [Thermoanaerobaculia bacterium]